MNMFIYQWRAIYGCCGSGASLISQNVNSIFLPYKYIWISFSFISLSFNLKFIELFNVRLFVYQITYFRYLMENNLILWGWKKISLHVLDFWLSFKIYKLNKTINCEWWTKRCFGGSICLPLVAFWINILSALTVLQTNWRESLSSKQRVGEASPGKIMFKPVASRSLFASNSITPTI